MLVVVEDANVANLSAGIGIERRVIKDYFAMLAGFENLHTLAIFYDGQYFAARRFSLAVAFKNGFI